MYVGIDLALPGRRRTGFGVLSVADRTYYVDTLASREEIVNAVMRWRPVSVCIDAPLGLPRRGVNRLVEVKARERGLRLIPPLFGPMRELTMYGIDLANKLRELGFKVLECHPTSTLKILRIGRNEFLELIMNAFRGPPMGNTHELDALVAAFTCLLHDRGCTEEIAGYEGEGSLVIPRYDCVKVVLDELVRQHRQ